MEYGENYYFIYPDGEVLSAVWLNSKMDNGMYRQNNVFESREAALLESERRALVAKIQRFRDKCNEGKQLDLDDVYQTKYFIAYSKYSGELFVGTTNRADYFVRFGYFANIGDAEAVIHVFGSEIKRLFTEVTK